MRLPCLVVRDQAGGVVLVARVPRAGFALSYRHSVTRETVYEYLRAAPGGGLQLYATAFGGGGGAGLPFDEPGARVSVEGDRVVMRDLDRRFSRISVRPLALTEHRLLVGRRDCDLLALLGGSGVAQLAVEARSALRLLRAEGASKSRLRGVCREREGS